MKEIRPVSVITTLYNESSRILEFLESLEKQTVFPAEVVLVDGGSEDGTVEKIEQFAASSSLIIRLIVDPYCNRKHHIAPISLGRNIAIGAVSQEYILVTDAGCVLDFNWIDRLSKPLLAGEATFVGGKSLVLKENKFSEAYEQQVLHSSFTRTFMPSSRNIGFAKKAWLEVGKYPDTTFLAEDTLFNLNVLAKGYKFHFVADAMVYWIAPTDISEAQKKHYNYGFYDGKMKLYLLRNASKAAILPIIVFYLRYYRRMPVKAKLFRSYFKGYFSGLRSSFA